jgi:hypothetical protein
MSKTMSPEQIAANQANAQKSTGPRTDAGRAASRRNALKHGILSREVLVQGRHRQESGEDLADLRKRLWEDWEPLGATEEMLVDQIVTTHWRLRRALTAESGEIALSVDEGQWKRSRPKDPARLWMDWEELGDPVNNMKNSTLGCEVIEQWLRDLRAAVEREGELTAAAIKASCGGRSNSLTRDLEGLRTRLQQNPEGLEEAALRARQKEQALAYLDEKLTVLAWQKEDCENRERTAEQARQAAAVLPSLEVLDKILRYETKLERQMFRALAQLERLQRMRRGEAIPAPLTVEVSEKL